ncbi:MAG TPA: hypothetical protein PK358_05065 [Spirochaetota bacterium]|nr:hypothetical protein [Spirochaetota bacterium]HPJ34184.1 hypothetical protein [Spirochaetota bacterium]
MQIELNNEENAILEEMLKRALAEIPIEIHHCTTRDFKEHLKNKQKIIDGVFQKIKKAG